MTPMINGSFVLETKGIQLLKQYTFKNEYNLFRVNKSLIGIKGKEIFISDPIEDNSKKDNLLKNELRE
ncbi:hypothetical protein [Mycoplasmopsis cynos]|uniref:hypothetical protein n=1 Tax=Mycoplasmopsis cynos TaxID=171284 RepID=UPI002B000260|nr:hypothetical protein [Mycoplasmopsis cynos]WQQ14843.1 hypothetical protein RRG42_00670 [Mycoplasmopsis cynos]